MKAARVSFASGLSQLPNLFSQRISFRASAWRTSRLPVPRDLARNRQRGALFRLMLLNIFGIFDEVFIYSHLAPVGINGDIDDFGLRHLRYCEAGVEMTDKRAELQFVTR